jgi:hypothetical protein
VNAKSDLKVFAFLTNVHFTMGEQSEMKEEARKAGIGHCDILDRERLRIELDSPAGFFIRFQHLAIPLSEAEQASFLARYGDRIQEVVSTGFQRIERTLGRILFLQESADVLDGISVRFRLKQSYPATDIGHFRAFVSLYLRAITHEILALWFGSTDKADRFRDDIEQKRDRAGIANGIATGQWEKHVRLPRPGEKDEIRPKRPRTRVQRIRTATRIPNGTWCPSAAEARSVWTRSRRSLFTMHMTIR